MGIRKIYNVLSRKRTYIAENMFKTELSRQLRTFDLVALGSGCTLGVGAYVLAGQVSKNTAGPAVIISFIIGAIASILAGLCYAEFGARVPKAGQAYTYAYVTMGEFIAFVIGWDSVLEYSIGAASVAKALSTYLDSLIENRMSQFFIHYLPLPGRHFSDYFDVFAFLMIMVFAGALSLGIKTSAVMGEIFTITNIVVLLFTILAGATKCDSKNWSIPKSELPTDAYYGDGGFAPYGLSGIVKGSAICFYGYIGFDIISAAGEEIKNPTRSIPIAIICSLMLTLAAYMGISSVLTLMVPYYSEDADAPFPAAFEKTGLLAARYIVTAGALFGLFSSLMGAFLPLPRVLYAMARDGLIFPFFAIVHPFVKAPVIGTLVAGLITAIIATMFNLSQLVNMLSIGTLLAYTIVAGCALLLRYEVDVLYDVPDKAEPDSYKGPTTRTSAVATLSASVYCICCFGSSITLTRFRENLGDGSVGASCALAIFFLVMIICLIVIYLQPQSCTKLIFKVPFMPWLPGVSIFMNIYLTMELDIATWVRFVVWLLIGFVIYFGYGIRHSHVGREKNNPTTNEIES